MDSRIHNRKAALFPTAYARIQHTQTAGLSHKGAADILYTLA